MYLAICQLYTTLEINTRRCRKELEVITAVTTNCPFCTTKSLLTYKLVCVTAQLMSCCEMKWQRFSAAVLIWKWNWANILPMAWEVRFDCYWPLGFCMTTIVRLSLKWLSCGAKHLEYWTRMQCWPLPCLALSLWNSDWSMSQFSAQVNQTRLSWNEQKVLSTPCQVTERVQAQRVAINNIPRKVTERK